MKGLGEKLLEDLKTIAKEVGVDKIDKLKKQDLIYKILDTQAENITKSVPDGDIENKPKRTPRPRPAKKKVETVKPNKSAKTKTDKPIEKQAKRPRLFQ